MATLLAFSVETRLCEKKRKCSPTSAIQLASKSEHKLYNMVKCKNSYIIQPNILKSRVVVVVVVVVVVGGCENFVFVFYFAKFLTSCV